jgi:hypothetical protein
VSPGKGWLRASDDAVREVGIEAVLQESSGAFMLYYERIRNGDGDKPRLVWPPHSGTEEEENDDDEEMGKVGDDDEKKALTLRLRDGPKREASADEEMDGKEKEKGKGKEKTALVIKARVVRSVSLGRDDDGDDDDGCGRDGCGGVKLETDPDAEARLLLSSSMPTPAKLEPVGVELTDVAAVSANGPPPIPDAPPTVDEPPIAEPQA